MADVITRFKLETTQYDSKLRDASQQLAQYAREAKTAGNDFRSFSQEQTEAARALGSIATSANNSKDKVHELTNAFNSVAKAYNALSDEQRQSDFGKNMAESLNTLKGRLSEAKQELYSTGGFMEGLTDKLTVNIDALKLFNAGLQAAKIALSVAKDAFFASESNVDEWGRTVAASQSIYEGFLTAINNGDISGYLSNIDNIVKAAREAYNELDKLGTMRTIQSPKMSEQEAENNRLRTMIMTGRFIAAPGRVSPLGLKTGDKLTADQIRTLEKQLQNGMQKIVGLVGKEVAQTGRAIDAYYNKLAQQNGMSLSEFRQGTSSWEAYTQRMAGYEKYQTWRRENTFVDPWGNRQVREGNPYQEYKKWGVFRVDKMGENSYNDLVNLIKQQQQQQSQMYSMLGQSYRTINRVEGYNPRSVLGGGGGGGSTGGSTGGTTGTAATITPGSVADYNNQIKNLRAEQLQVTSPEAWMGLQQQIDHLNVLIKELKGELKVEPYNFGSDASKRADNYWGELEKKFSNPDKIISESLSRIVNNINRGQGKSSEFPQELSKITGGVSSIMGGIQQLGLDVPESMQKMIALMQGMNTILTGIMALTSIIQVNSTTQAAASVIDAMTPFHFGGVVHAANGFAGKVPGTAYSGDNIPALLDAGEVVLTRAMAGNVASQLEGNNLGNLQLEAIVYAEQLRFLLRNNSKRRGKGEYITSKMKY